MPTVRDVIVFLEKLAPPGLAEDWDNTGLLVGRREARVEKIMTCLTLTPDVAAEAVRGSVQLVVSHHPVLFRGAKQITDRNSEGDMLLALIESGIAVYSPHTSYDSASNGINQQLAELFGLESTAPIRPMEDSEGVGSGRYGRLPEPISLIEFLEQARDAVSAEYLEYCGSAEARVSMVAVACGSAGEYLKDALRLGCDTFITGEGRFHSALEARQAGVSLIFLGHYSSERPAIEKLASILAAQFPSVEAFASRDERDPLAVFPS